MNWVEQANCAGTDPEAFFPPPSQAHSISTRQVLKTCAACLVQTECLQFAIEQSIEYGIFGGLTPRQRRQVKHRQRAKQAA